MLSMEKRKRMRKNNFMIKIALIPIDNRPICYDLIQDVLSIDKNIQVFLPELKDLGGLTTQSNIDRLFAFIMAFPPSVPKLIFFLYFGCFS